MSPFSRNMTEKSTRIILRLPNWLGDVVMGLGCVRNLGHLFPEACLEIIVREDMAALVEQFPYVSKVHAFPRDRCRGLRKLYKYGKVCRSDRPVHYYITLPYSFSSAWMGYAIGASTRIGLRGDARSFLFTHAYGSPQRIHRAELYNSLLERHFSLAPRPLDVSFSLSPAAAPILPEAPLRIALGFISNNTARTLPIPLAHLYIDRLVEAHEEAQFFLIGAQDHRDYLEEIISKRPKLQNRLHNIAGQTTPLQLAYLLSEVDLLISTESGPAHLANSLGTSLLLLCGAEDENLTGPYMLANQIRLRAKDIPCAPCFQETCKLTETRCLLEITAEEVVSASEKLLNREKKSPKTSPIYSR